MDSSDFYAFGETGGFCVMFMCVALHNALKLVTVNVISGCAQEPNSATFLNGYIPIKETNLKTEKQIQK